MLEQINKDLVPVKAHYFLYNAATGVIVPFLPVIGKQLGFSSSMIGTIYMMMPFSGLIVKPLFCRLADRFGLHKALFLFFQVILCIGFLIVPFIPELEPEAKVNLSCDSQETFLQIPLIANTDAAEYARTHEYPNNTYSECQLSCNANSQIYMNFCHNMKLEQFCKYKELQPDTTFEFTPLLNMYKKHVFGSSNNSVDIHVFNVTFANGERKKLFCKELTMISCLATCPGDQMLRKLLRDEKLRQNPATSNSGYRYYMFFAAAAISWVGMAVVVSISDAICLAILGDDKHRDYGKQRMWGSIGFGIFGISGGYLVDTLSSDENYKDYTCIFYVLVIGMIFDFVVSLTLRTKGMSCKKEGEPLVMHEVGMLCRDPKILAFAFWLVGVGMCTGIIWNFLFWFIETLASPTQKHSIKTLQGLLTGVQCFLGEMPFNFLSGTVLKKLGHINVLSLVLLVYAMRFMAYSLTTNMWVFLLLELLHGPSFGLCWPAAVSFAEKVAPPGTKAPIQGLVGAVFEGIGVALGSILCGVLMDKYGGQTMFQIFSGGALAWLAIYWLSQVALRRAKSYPIHQGHNHLASYAPPDDALLMTTSQELQTY